MQKRYHGAAMRLIHAFATGEIQSLFEVFMLDSGDTPPAGRYARDRTGRYAFTRRRASLPYDYSESAFGAPRYE